MCCVSGGARVRVGGLSTQGGPGQARTGRGAPPLGSAGPGPGRPAPGRGVAKRSEPRPAMRPDGIALLRLVPGHERGHRSGSPRPQPSDSAQDSRGAWPVGRACVSARCADGCRAPPSPPPPALERPRKDSQRFSPCRGRRALAPGWVPLEGEARCCPTGNRQVPESPSRCASLPVISHLSPCVSCKRERPC